MEYQVLLQKLPSNPDPSHAVQKPRWNFERWGQDENLVDRSDQQLRTECSPHKDGHEKEEHRFRGMLPGGMDSEGTKEKCGDNMAH